MIYQLTEEKLFQSLPKSYSLTLGSEINFGKRVGKFIKKELTSFALLLSRKKNSELKNGYSSGRNPV